MKILLLVFFLLLPVKLVKASAKDQSVINILSFNQLEPSLHKENDTIYIINFWATWCAPCRKELPDLEKINCENKENKVKVLLISLDFVSQIEKSLIPFIKENNITAEVILLNDTNSNSWIDKVDPDWSGSLPATLIYQGNNRQFIESEVDYIFLKNKINELFKP